MMSHYFKVIPQIKRTKGGEDGATILGNDGWEADAKYVWFVNSWICDIPKQMYFCLHQKSFLYIIEIYLVLLWSDQQTFLFMCKCPTATQKLRRYKNNHTLLIN